ncbi:tetratricopeptide repeat protein [Thermodesulfobacteriota bacterium]
MEYKHRQKEGFGGILPEVWVGLFLIVVILTAYGQVRNFEFINYDDNAYVTENQYVKAGLTLEGIAWAFNFKEYQYLTYWHPITWLSHMLDVQIFGMNPGGHHITSLFFHILNSLLLFLVFNRMTGALWRSALMVALFAIHPLNAEPVAWVAERMNVLSTFFWMLTMLFYVYYVARPVFSRYLLTVMAFILGLMAKPMLVTLPCVMLLLDYWPLGRFEFRTADDPVPGGTARSIKPGMRKHPVIRPVLEKIPFLALSAASVYLSSSTLLSFKTMVSTELVPMKLRIANALVSYVKYIQKMIWPQDLAVLYPYPQGVPVWQVVGAILFLSGVSILVLRGIRSRPYLGIGWLWYLGTLVPVIGLAQTGLWPEMADRWAYVPLIGLFIMISWGVPEILKRWRYKEICFVVLSSTILVILMTVTSVQVRYWQNSLALFERALAVTDRNTVAHNNLGVTLENQGKTTEAIRHYQAALRIDPNYSQAHNNLGNALASQGKLVEAIKHYFEAIHLDPSNKEAHYNLGGAFLAQGKLDRAIGYYLAALQADPFYAEAHNNLGAALAKQGQTLAAAFHFQKALRIDPDYKEARDNLQSILTAQKKIDQTILARLQALALNPDDPVGHYELGNLYKRKGELDKAGDYYQKALSLQSGLVPALDGLAIVKALKGEYKTARALFKKSIRLQPDRAYIYYYVAGTFARQNKIKASLAWLKQAADKGFKDWKLLADDSNFENIRSTSYFKGLVPEH